MSKKSDKRPAQAPLEELGEQPSSEATTPSRPAARGPVTVDPDLLGDQETKSLHSQDTLIFRERAAKAPPIDQIHDANTAILEATLPTMPDVSVAARARARYHASLEEELHSTAEVSPGPFQSQREEITESLVAHPSFASVEIEFSSEVTSSPVAALAGEQRAPSFGNYRLLRRLKAGGMGEVYQGVYTSAAGVERPVAIKRILLPFMERDEFVRMFIDEAKLTVQLNHASITQVLELGRVGDEYFIAMDYVDGRDLATILHTLRERDELLSIPVALHIAHHVLEALDHAHHKRDASGGSLGIVHRDVSPPNILCSFEGQVKLTDFGVAKVTSKLERTRPGLLVGKLAYMSPEQLQSRPIDHRSDIFAASIVLHELLTAEPLFAADAEIRTVVKLIDEPIPTVRSRRADIPEELDAIIMKGLERDPNQRYQRAAEMSEALQHFMLKVGYRLPSSQLAKLMEVLYAGEPAGSPI